MEKAYDYITNAKYPIEMDVISIKLCELCKGNEDFSSLYEEAIMNNSEKIKSEFMPKIKKQGENLADSKKADYLAEVGIPEFDKPLKNEILNLCKKIFNGSTFNQVHFMNHLEKYFYSSYTCRLIQKNHFFSDRINQVLYEMSHINSIRFQEHLNGINNGFIIETRLISQNLGIQINRIERIYPKLQKILNKRCHKNFMKVFEQYIHYKLSLISQKNINEDLDLIKLSCLILFYYQGRSTESFDYLRYLVEMCFKIMLKNEESSVFWGYISMKERIDTFIYIYLIASKKLPVLLKIPEDYYSWFINSQLNDFSSIRETLRKISKIYKIFLPSPDNSHYTYVKNPFECFKLIEMNFYQYLLDHSLIQNPEIYFNSKKFKKITTNNSSHIVILVSGYLSQADEHEKEWENLISLYPNNTFYSYTWKSSTLKDMIFSVLKLSFGRKHFNEVYLKAEKEGVKLSKLLMQSNVFQGKSISLIGFSLGTVVINSCLQNLCSERMKIIHDCILLGSAVDIKAAQFNQYQRDHVVTGKFYNVFSTKDFILNEIFCLTARSSAFGVHRVPGMKNKDATGIICGHKKYRENLGKIFKKIKNF